MEGSDFETKRFGKCTAVEVTSNMDKLISSTTFIGEYLKNIPAEFEWQKSPIQIYPLSFLKNHFDLPLPVLRADYNFIFFIREGHFKQRLGTKRHRAEADSIVFVSTETVSALENISEDVKGYFVLIEDESMAKLFNQDELLNILMIDPVIKLHPGDSDWITGLLRLLYAELDNPYWNLYTANNLVQALLHKILHLSDHLKPVSRTQQVAIHFKQLVHQNYVEERATFFYAERLAISGCF